MTGKNGSGDGGGGERPGRGPADDPADWERRVESIVEAAEPELRRRARRPAAVGRQLERWARPVLAAAAALILAGSAVLVHAGDSPSRGSDAVTGGSAAAQGALVSPVVDPWLERDSLTVGAVEEMVSVADAAGGLR